MHRNEMTEIAQMVLLDRLDIRAVTMGISLLSCASDSSSSTADNVRTKIVQKAEYLIREAEKVQNEFGIPIRNKRISVTPIGLLAQSCKDSDYHLIAQAMDDAVEHLNERNREYTKDLNEADTEERGVTFIGGYSALVHKGYTESDSDFVDSIVKALSTTKHVCSSINVASTKAGINMEAIFQIAQMVKRLAASTNRAHGCAKFVVFANAPEDNPFMAGAFHGVGQPECVINVGISGPSVIKRVVEHSQLVDFVTLSDRIKRAIFKVVRAGELVGRKLATQLGVDFGIVDLSLAPTPDPGNSVANILEAMGLQRCGTHGTTAALALLIDAVKKGGVAATSSVGGLSGAFIPISEDLGMVDAVQSRALTLDKLESLTSVCSVGLDMFGVPGDTSEATIAAIIADEMAIGVMNNKTTAVRILPIPGTKPFDVISLREYNDLLGEVIIMDVNKFSSEDFFTRRLSLGRIPAPIRSLTN